MHLNSSYCLIDFFSLWTIIFWLLFIWGENDIGDPLLTCVWENLNSDNTLKCILEKLRYSAPDNEKTVSWSRFWGTDLLNGQQFG